jgi:hypothetical protein
MGVLIVPPLDDEPWPTLGPQVCDFIEDRAVFGPGSLMGQPAKLDDEKRAAIYRMYEVYPRDHEFAGRRRFKRAGLSWRKGLAKTEFGAWVSYTELHPEAEVRFDGWDAHGNPVGRPVVFPYIPMMAVTEEQVSELAYGVLLYIVQEGPDADLFDAGLDRIIRLDENGKPGGRAVPVANAPGSRDGALTTFQYFDEPHRLYLPNHLKAYETMMANLEKRVLEDPWALSTSTAGQPGQGSIEENTYKGAQEIAKGDVEEPDLFYFHRDSSGNHDLSTMEGRIAAIKEATGPVGEYGTGQFRGIAKQWDRKGADKAYLERVWLNRWRKSTSQAFDLEQWKRSSRVRKNRIPGLNRANQRIPKGAFVAGGFDGARFRDATALVITDIKTGLQELVGLWERPPDTEDWEVPENEVTELLDQVMKDYEVWKVYCDPPHWTETVGAWSVKYPDQIEEWWTAQPKRMAYAIREYVEALDSGSIGHSDAHPNDDDFLRHIGNAGRKDLRMRDDEDNPLWVMAKQEIEQKFDAAMAATLSGKAALDARKAGAKPRRKPRQRVRRMDKPG